jgi:hypothetical protein
MPPVIAIEFDRFRAALFEKWRLLRETGPRFQPPIAWNRMKSNSTATTIQQLQYERAADRGPQDQPII